MRLTHCSFILLFLFGCPDRQRLVEKRAEVRQLTGDSIEVLPGPFQLPYCLIFTTSEKGVIRQLTMTRENRSVSCEGGQPIGSNSYRIPVDEGKVKIHIFFSDQKLNAASVAQQISEGMGTADFNPMNLRLPGKVTSETLEFNPAAAAEPTLGARVGPGGELKHESPRGAASDAGTAAAGH